MRICRGIYSTAHNNKNQCGGTKKAGLPPSVGSMVLNQFQPAMNRTVHSVPKPSGTKAGGTGCSAPYLKTYLGIPGGVGMMYSFKN